MAPAKRLVVKVGSAVLTNPKGLDLAAVKRLSAGLCVLHDQGRDILLVTSGAVATGRRHMREHHQGAGRLELKDLPGRQAASAIGQSRLMHEYDKAFARRGKVTAQVLLTRDDLASRERFLNARNTLERLLSWRVIPIINENDVVADEEIKADLSLGDNDLLASLVARMVRADILILLTTVDGLRSNHGVKGKSRRIPCIESVTPRELALVTGAKSSLSKGGMDSKLRAAQTASRSGCVTVIANGRQTGVIGDIMSGKDVGTLILAAGI